MSVQAVQWVLRHSDEQRASRAVLIVLAEHAKADGTNAHPSIATIAREAGVSKRTVHYALRRLEQRGALRRGPRSRWRTVTYTVVMRPDGATGASVQSVHGATAAPVQKASKDGATAAPKPSRTTLSAAAARAREGEHGQVPAQVVAVQDIFEAFGPPGCQVDRESVENAAARFPSVDIEQAARGCAEWLRHHQRRSPSLSFHRWLEREALKLDRPPPTHRERWSRSLGALIEGGA